MKRFTYFAHCRETGLTKIGRSVRPHVRILAIRPKVKLIALIDEAELSETEAHALFAESRIRGEWFQLVPEDALARLEALGVSLSKGESAKEKAKAVYRARRILNFEISDEAGRRLDALAKRHYRSRASMAKHLLVDALDMLAGDNLTGKEAA